MVLYWRILENQDIYSGQGWYSILEGFDGLIGARNTIASQSPLHLEIDALIWAMKCMKNLRQFSVTFATDYFQLVKMVSEPEEWPASASYVEDITFLEKSFNSSKIIHIPRTQNSKAVSLARSARKQPLFVVYWMQSYRCGLKNLHKSVYVADKKKEYA